MMSRRRYEPKWTAISAMLTLLAALLGAVRGVFRARALGGKRLDMIQYATGYAIAFGLVAAIGGIVLARLLEL